MIERRVIKVATVVLNKDDKQAVMDILLKEFRSVYCDTCEGNLEEDYCEGCHRKYMNWGLSKSAASGIADEVIETLNKLHSGKETH